MIKKNIFLMALCFIISVQGLPPLVGQILRTIPKNPTPLFSPRQNIIGMLTGFLKETTLGDRICLATTHFTNKMFAQSLVDAGQRGAKVSVIIDNASVCNNSLSSSLTQEILSKLQKNEIHTHIFNPDGSIKNENGYPIQMHLKTAIWQHHQEGQPFFRVASGSANYSNAAEKNVEFVMFYPHNPCLYSFYEDYFQHIMFEQPFTLDQEFEESFGNQQILSSQNAPHSITIKRLLDSACAGDNIKISTYTFNNWHITNALIDCHKRGVQITLIIDGINLKDLRSKQQLSMLARSGISVLFYPSGSKINHAKYMLIKGKNNWDVIEGSGNLTYTADWDINQLTIHPNSRKLFRYLEKNFDETAQLCLPA